MSRRLKELICEELASRYRDAQTCVLVGYHGITASDASSLRRDLAAKNLSIKVIRNTIAVRAFRQIGLDVLTAFVDGPTAVISLDSGDLDGRGDSEIGEVCKAIVAWTRQNGKLKILGGMLNRQPISAQQVRFLASIPPIDTLRSQVLAGVQGPMVLLLWALQGLSRELACAVEAVRGQKAKEC